MPKLGASPSIPAAAAAFALAAGCTITSAPMGVPPGDDAAGEGGRAPLARVETLENRLRLLDENGDGFVGRTEAESFYRWRFARLDENGDGRLSRAELEVEFADVPDAEVAIEDLVGVSEEAYTRGELDRFDLRADRATGMMSTADFEAMVRAPETAPGDRRPMPAR